MSTLELKTTVLPGGRIEVQTPGFTEGQEITVRIAVSDEAPRRRISDILADYPGGRLFKSAAEVDQSIREERESWGD